MELLINELMAQISIALDIVEQDLLGATPYHGKRVGLLCLAMGRRLGYDDARLSDLACCGMLHDNALTEYLLSERPGQEQQIHLKTHCTMGENNMRCLPMHTENAGYVLYHHERADGQGPFNIPADELPQEAALIAIADQIDVRFRLQQVKPERLDEIKQFIEAQAGTAFTRTAAQALIDVLDVDFLEKVREGRVLESLKQELPRQRYNLSADEILRLSGMIARIIDYKSSFTRTHSVQIANKMWLMTDRYGYSFERRAQVYLAAALHDLGKLTIPNNILEKPGALTPEEFGIVKNHAAATIEILSPISGLEEITRWAGEHHEKLTGAGYPLGKKADELCFESRLMACLDIYQAVRETRPYHPSRTHAQTMEILQGMASNGLIDQRITDDIDKFLHDLPEGETPTPEAADIRSIDKKH